MNQSFCDTSGSVLNGDMSDSDLRRSFAISSHWNCVPTKGDFERRIDEEVDYALSICRLCPCVGELEGIGNWLDEFLSSDRRMIIGDCLASSDSDSESLSSDDGDDDCVPMSFRDVLARQVEECFRKAAKRSSDMVASSVRSTFGRIIEARKKKREELEAQEKKVRDDK